MEEEFNLTPDLHLHWVFPLPPCRARRTAACRHGPFAPSPAVAGEGAQPGAPVLEAAGAAERAACLKSPAMLHIPNLLVFPRAWRNPPDQQLRVVQPGPHVHLAHSFLCPQILKHAVGKPSPLLPFSLPLPIGIQLSGSKILLAIFKAST